MGRAGDHLLIPFECDLCIFRKLKKMNPLLESTRDNLLLACIRRVNLDAMWSRTTNTVVGNRDRIGLGLRLSDQVGLDGPYEHFGPLPFKDHCGYEVAIQMVLHSRLPGRYSKDHTQFDTIRQLRTAYSNQVKAAPQANWNTLAIGDSKGRYQRLGQDPCGSFWFYRFNIGLKNRMGQDWRPNRALSTKLLLKVLSKANEKSRISESKSEKHRWLVFLAYAMVCYVTSLRGVEGFLLDLDGLIRYWSSERKDYIIIALLGKIKGESNDAAHLIPCVSITSSGINVREVIERLIMEKKNLGLKDGPAISNTMGKLIEPSEIDEMLIKVLVDCYQEERVLFPADMDNEEKLRDSYQCFRTFRRTSDTRALEKKVSDSDMDIVNRWKAVETAAGRVPGRSMRQHYAQLELLLGPFLRYTFAM